MRGLPVAWDETRYVAGEPGKFVVLARRSGAGWYVGAINGQEEPIRVSVPLDFLGPGSYEALIIGDGNDPRSFSTREITAKAGEAIPLSLRPRGGGVMQIMPQT